MSFDNQNVPYTKIDRLTAQNLPPNITFMSSHSSPRSTHKEGKAKAEIIIMKQVDSRKEIGHIVDRFRRYPF